MILGFKTQINNKPTGFVDKILKGEKVTTIREDKKNRWNAKNKIHFATGVRTKNYKQFAEGECVKVQEIRISYSETNLKDGFISLTEIFVDGECLTMWQMEELAKADGFENTQEFLKWFNKDFEGKIIHFKVHGS